MTWAEYRTTALESAVYPKETAKDYVLLGLVSEVGELAGIAKRILRGDHTLEQARPKILKELGDICWYVAACEREYGFSLSFDLPRVLIPFSGGVSLIIGCCSDFLDATNIDVLRLIVRTCAGIAIGLDSSLSEVLEANIAKTRDRVARGVVMGEGSER